jgi:hypothetical protein
LRDIASHLNSGEFLIMYDLTGLPQSTQDLIASDYAELFSKKPTKLLSVGADAKTVKGSKLGFLTGILYFMPAGGSGVNVCPMSELAQCAKPCLFKAGRGQMTGVQMSRLRKTLFFHQYRAEFLALLRKEVSRVVRKAQREGLTPLVRLNGTSDIRWETVDPTLFAEFSTLQFYDYTKIPNRHNVPANYDLTFSYSGVPAYRWAVDKAVAAGMRIATVFRTRSSIPTEFLGLDVVDGDNSDVRHIDPLGVIVALYAKGPAIHDRSGFVVDAA